MSQRVKCFVQIIVQQAVADVLLTRQLRDCRFGLFNEKIPGGGFCWICLDTFPGDDQELSLWAHTNDFDGMVYGWSACEFDIVTRDARAGIEQICAFLSEKTSACERVEVKIAGTASDGHPIAMLVGDSDSGQIKEPPDRPSI